MFDICIMIQNYLYIVYCILITFMYVLQLKKEAYKKIHYYINHDDATQQLMFDNMTSDVPDVVSYIRTWEEKFGNMAFLVEIPTKVNAKIVWRNNISNDQPYSTAIMCRIIYRYIKFILIANGNFEVIHHGGLLGHLQKDCFGILKKENGHVHIAKRGVSIWTFPTVLYQKK